MVSSSRLPVHHIVFTLITYLSLVNTVFFLSGRMCILFFLSGRMFTSCTVVHSHSDGSMPVSITVIRHLPRRTDAILGCISSSLQIGMHALAEDVNRPSFRANSYTYRNQPLSQFNDGWMYMSIGWMRVKSSMNSYKQVCLVCGKLYFGMGEWLLRVKSVVFRDDPNASRDIFCNTSGAVHI